MGEHGTQSAYCNDGCLCVECRAAHAACNHEYDKRNKEKKSARDREYYQRNRDRVLLTVRKHHRTEQGKRISRKRNGTRRARQKSQFIEAVDPLVVYQMHGGMCGICEEFVDEGDFHVDHVIPLSRGGLHGYINVQPAHPSCNLKKYNNEER